MNIKIPTYLVAFKDKFSKKMRDDRFIRTVRMATNVLVIMSFVLNIVVAFNTTDVESLRFNGIMGWAMATIWFLFMRVTEKQSDHWFGELMKMIEEHKKLLNWLDGIIKKAEDEVEQEKKSAAKKATSSKKPKS